MSIQLSLLFILFAAACAVLIGYQLSNIDETARSLRLQRQAREIGQALHVASGAIPTEELPAERMARYQGEAPAFFYAVRDGAGDLLATSSKTLQDKFGAQFLRQVARGETDTEAKDGSDNAFYFLAGPVDAPGVGDLFLIVGQHASETDVLLRDVEWRLLSGTALAAIPLCLIVFAASLTIVRFGFAPVRRLSQEADRIGPGDPAARIAEADLPVELRGLAEAANAAAGRLQQAITSQRRFTADTAHQLLTPLALLSARIEQSAVPHPDPGLRGDIVRMQNLVRQLLNLSRLAVVPRPQEKVDLRTVAKDVVTAMAPLAIAEGKSLSYEACETPCLTTGDASAIGEALANVIRNGLRHTAPGTCVDIAVEQPASITVADKGDGIAEAHRQRLLEPFFTTEADRGGSGLGLAIVDEIMRQHGGAVEAENCPEGGALFRLRFKKT
ncbi:sensor histidine kinase [Mesorhizobium carmichaelinearum]|uniref:sensor histidine kinase n=1 Tax=Mesorhizobium carmichaelinearum TaxID=1208188 RepID=UPI00117D81B4|nr:HAMP domain-containing sensor histidine kinase [Mesorhizobium carmichaelinearum]